MLRATHYHLRILGMREIVERIHTFLPVLPHRPAGAQLFDAKKTAESGEALTVRLGNQHSWNAR